DLSKQYEEIKNDFKSLQENYVELKNQLDANNKFMADQLEKNNEKNRKFVTSQFRQSNDYLIETLTNQT
ncbi:4719_t:CDS:1, partial [Entrophospora sp. SA101]